MVAAMGSVLRGGDGGAGGSRRDGVGCEPGCLLSADISSLRDGGFAVLGGSRCVRSGHA